MFLNGAAAAVLAAASAAAWGPSTHAWLARQTLEPSTSPEAAGLVVLGAVTPDFFWYLADTGVIDYEAAYRLHGVTEEPYVSSATTFLYDYFIANFTSNNLAMSYMAEGIRTHLYADVLAHNTADGYVEGQGMWIDALQGRTGEADREACHLALEFAVDSLVVRGFGPQLYRIDAGSLPEDLPGRRELEEYVGLIKTLESAAGVYGAYLRSLADNPMEDAPIRGVNPRESASVYARAARILLLYPREIRATVTSEEIHWESALREVVASFAE